LRDTIKLKQEEYEDIKKRAQVREMDHFEPMPTITGEEDTGSTSSSSSTLHSTPPSTSVDASLFSTSSSSTYSASANQESDASLLRPIPTVQTQESFEDADNAPKYLQVDLEIPDNLSDEEVRSLIVTCPRISITLIVIWVEEGFRCGICK
jgi:hypothetical protein